MRPQSSAMHVAYNRWREELDEKSIYHFLRERFPRLSSWATKSAVKQAQGILASQSALPESRRQYLVGKIEKLSQKCESNQKLLPRLKKAQALLESTQLEISSGKVNPVIFGGKELWKQVSRQVPGAKEKWRRARGGQYYSIGGSSTRGNREFRLELEPIDGKAILQVRLPGDTADEKAEWVSLPGCYTRKQKRLFEIAASGSCFTVRLVSEEKGRMTAWIALDEIISGRLIPDNFRLNLPCQSERIAGIDLNLDHMAITFVDKQGQYRGGEILPYENLGELPKAKTKPIVGQIAKQTILALIAKGAGELVLEDLSIDRRAEQSSSLNRRTIPFPYRQLHQAILRRAARAGLIVKLVHPAYTSLIGQEKYMDQYGISRHAAAAYVIARRGMGLLEKVPKRTIQQLKTMDVKSKKDIETIHCWKKVSPLAGKPWLLWALLVRNRKKSLGVANPARGTTNRRKNMRFRPGSADNIRPEDPPDSRSGVSTSGMSSRDGT